MRIYDGSPREHFSDVLRALGAALDERGLHEILILEEPGGFIVQGIVAHEAPPGGRGEAVGQEVKLTLRLDEDEVARLLDQAAGRRADREAAHHAGPYEQALRVLGRYIDQQHPRDIFLFEQDGSYVVRLLTATQAGSRHVLAEFTREDLVRLVAEGPAWRDERAGPPAAGAPRQGAVS